MCISRHLILQALIVGALFGPLKIAAAQDINALETKIDKTIRAACHGFMVDAIPDYFSWLRKRIYENSPFCTRIDSAYDEIDINDAIQKEYKQATKPGGGLDLSSKRDRSLKITIECQSEYMCMESRLRYRDSTTPVSQTQYDKVAQFCDGRYGCIQAFFDKWPAPIPEAKPVAQSDMLTFSAVLEEEPATASPTTSTTTTQAQTAAVAPAPPKQVFVNSGTKPTAENLKLNKQIAKLCSCSLAGRTCIQNQYGPVRARIAKVEAQRAKMCRNWQQSYSSIESSTLVDNGKMAEDLSYSLKSVRDADARGNYIVRLAEEDFVRVSYRARNNIPFRDTFEHNKADVAANGPSKNIGAPPPGYGTGTSQSSQTASASPSSADDQAENPSVSANKLLFSPNILTFADATAFCRRNGLRLPTVAEAKARLSEMTEGEDFFGIWTTDQTTRDKMVNRYRTLRSNGFTEGESKYTEHRTYCFPS